MSTDDDTTTDDTTAPDPAAELAAWVVQHYPSLIQALTAMAEHNDATAREWERAHHRADLIATMRNSADLWRRRCVELSELLRLIDPDAWRDGPPVFS